MSHSPQRIRAPRDATDWPSKRPAYFSERLRCTLGADDIGAGAGVQAAQMEGAEVQARMEETEMTPREEFARRLEV